MHNHKINRLFSISLIALLVVLMLAEGCSSASTTTTSSATTQATTTTTPAPVTTTSQATATATTTTTQAQSIELNISAAASLSNVLKEIDTAYTKLNPNIKITANFAGSGTLQQQIEQGAPADVFISAAATQMDNLQKEKLILTDTRIDLLNNTLVLIVPNDSTLGLTGYNDLTSDKVVKIAIGDPKSVPCGTYALQVFDELGITRSSSLKKLSAAVLPRC